jgi:DNA-binding response OmpR family regulator
MKILIVEDEIEILKNVSEYLEKEEYVCEEASSYAEGLDKITVYDYDCILLDINLPGGSGLELLEQLKEMNKMDGVIIISAKDSIEDKVKSLELGADDYLTKPFHLSELNARIKSLYRRKAFDGNNKITFDNLTLDFAEKSVKVREKPVKLTKTEFQLLTYLFANKNRVVPKESIAEHLYGDHIDQSDSYDFLYSHIKNLKRKMMVAGSSDYIKSIYGMGYKFEVD